MKKLLIGFLLFLTLIGFWRMSSADMGMGMTMGMDDASAAAGAGDQAFVDSEGNYFLDSEGNYLRGATP
jgi:hypothetical protein